MKRRTLILLLVLATVTTWLCLRFKTLQFNKVADYYNAWPQRLVPGERRRLGLPPAPQKMTPAELGKYIAEHEVRTSVSPAELKAYAAAKAKQRANQAKKAPNQTLNF